MRSFQVRECAILKKEKVSLLNTKALQFSNTKMCHFQKRKTYRFQIRKHVVFKYNKCGLHLFLNTNVLIFQKTARHRFME